MKQPVITVCNYVDGIDTHMIHTESVTQLLVHLSMYIVYSTLILINFILSSLCLCNCNVIINVLHVF